MKSWFEHLKQGLHKGLPEEKISKHKRTGDFKTNLKNLKPFLLKHWPKALAGVFLILVTAPVSYVSPLLYRYFIDTVILGKQISLLIWVLLILVSLKVFEKLSNAAQNFYFTRFGRSVILDIQHDLIGRVLHFPQSFFDDKETGYLMSRISQDTQSLQWFFSGTIVYTITYALQFIVGAVFLFYLEWRLALVSLVFLPFLVFCAYYFSGKTRILSHHFMEQQARVSKRLQESLSAVPLIKAFVSEKRETGRIMEEMDASYQVALEQTAVQSLAGLTINSLSDIARLLVLAAGAPMIILGKWTLGSLYAYLAYQDYVFNPAQFFAHLNLQFQSALAALERVSAFYDILPEQHGRGNIKVEHLKGEIEFKNISFSYNGKEEVLDNVSFSINKGEHIAVVGPSGVGKTTLISLVLGFYQPAKGEILFDGVSFSDFAIDSLRKRIGYVSQSTRLLTGTIMENLRYGNAGADEEAVIAAARVAGIHDFIDGLPDKYQSLLGENGVNLSEGQRQRLSIARALIKDPDIFIFDEPSSSLDSISERSMIEMLPDVTYNKTLIMVTHRLSTMKKVDRILVFDENQLIAEGTIQSLSKGNVYFQHLMLSALDSGSAAILH